MTDIASAPPSVLPPMAGPADVDDDLLSTLDAAWSCLSRGVSDRQSAYHTPSIATVGIDGAPSLRTVVLRGIDRDRRHLRFHTDLRSPKVAEIRAKPALALHAYDSSSKVQLRLQGLATLHSDDAVAAEAWQQSRLMSRACYRAPSGPGTRVDAPPAAIVADKDRPDDGRGNFCAVLCTIHQLEWLHLAAAGHRRARFAWAEDGSLTTSVWLAP